MRTSIIIPTHNHQALTRACLEHIRRFTSAHDYELIVVDNGSTDGSAEWLAGQPDVRLLRNRVNAGYPAACNQGLAAATGDRLLLLNNDTRVTPRWLDQLLAAMDSDERVGAVGPVTNSAAYYTSMPVPYESPDDMLPFAESYNRSDPAKWEERMKLIGFCLLLRREAYERIGPLDERFSPGNFEDDDYCTRLRLAGYRLLLCADTFVHHEGSATFQLDNSSFADTVQRNGVKFTEKWGYSPNVFRMRDDFIGWIDEPRETPLRILELDCAGGATLLELKGRYPHAELFGIERHEGAAELASLVASVTVGEPESVRFPERLGTFDYILLGDELERQSEPVALLRKFVPYLKDDGKLLARAPNVAHYKIVRRLLRGEWTAWSDRSPLRFYTLDNLASLFRMAGALHLEYRGQTSGKPAPRDEHWMRDMAAREGEAMKSQWLTSHYVVKAHFTSLSPGVLNSSGYPRLKSLMRRLEWDVEPASAASEIAALFASGEVRLLDAARLLERGAADLDGMAAKLAALLRAHGLVDSEAETFRELRGGNARA